jgi:hypothetical protein
MEAPADFRRILLPEHNHSTRLGRYWQRLSHMSLNGGAGTTGQVGLEGRENDARGRQGDSQHDVGT